MILFLFRLNFFWKLILVNKIGEGKWLYWWLKFEDIFKYLILSLWFKSVNDY